MRAAAVQAAGCVWGGWVCSVGPHALATWADDGVLIQPLDVADEDVTVDILRHLIAQGHEGDELIEQYKQMKSKIVSVKRAIAEAEEDVAAGRVEPYENMRARIRDRYGI